MDVEFSDWKFFLIEMDSLGLRSIAPSLSAVNSIGGKSLRRYRWYGLCGAVFPHGKIQLCQLNSRSNPGGSNCYYSILCNRDFYCWLICNSAKDMTWMGLGAQPCCGLELSFLSISPHPCHYFLVVPYRPMAWRDSRIVLKTTSQAGRSGERHWLNNWIQTKIACDNWLESLL